MTVWIERVPTDFNVADGPSREDYDILLRMDPPATWVAPVLDEVFGAPRTWEALSVGRVANLKRAVSPVVID